MLLGLLDLASGLVGLIILIEEILGCGDSGVELSTLTLQVPDLVVEPSLDLSAMDFLDRGESFPVHVVMLESREKSIEEVIGRIEIICLKVVGDHVVDQALGDGGPIGGRQFLVQPVQDPGDLGVVSWHLF